MAGILWWCILIVCAGCATVVAAYVAAIANPPGIACRYDTMRPASQRTWRIGCGMIVAGLAGLGVIPWLLPS